MRQVLINSAGALVARMPAPTVAPGSVLVRVRYSLISTGTELASLAPIAHSMQGGSALEQAAELSSKAAFYLAKAVRDPKKAAAKARQILGAYAGQQLARVLPATPTRPAAAREPLGPLIWGQGAATAFSTDRAQLSLTTDASPASYQAISSPLRLAAGHSLELSLEGEITGAPLGIGLLNHDRSAWITLITLEAGPIDERLLFDVPPDNATVTVVIANAGAERPASLRLTRADALSNPPDASGLPASEMGQTGWSVGYSAAGEVVTVGQDVREFAPGDVVACSGAGQANHADFILVKRNLVAKVPPACRLEFAATTTLGAIAMQGVRRAAPQLGEAVCVIGLGLIGMLTMQLLKASGCLVIGMDINKARVAKARELGIDAATADAAELGAIVRDLTGGRGADQTIITAASKSHDLINRAMEVTRRKGRVVVVGDIGLKPERTHFYKKEIDLLMSTSYGPGRYDASYEEQGIDYPVAYVRWTQNRNMLAYLELIARGAIDVGSLIELIVPIDTAPAAYRQLAQSGKPLPLAVLLAYPDDTRALPEPAAASRISLKGHASPRGQCINYALVGAGAFGTQVLVAQMDKQPKRFHLRAVVSRDAVRGGNFARARRVETLTTDLKEVLADPLIDLIVIATRHNEHAAQSVAALKAGKAVFVEKPLAITWTELDEVRHAYEAAGCGTQLMLGFNRRFAPAVEKLREAIANRRSPLQISYRLNGGFIPAEHWVQTHEGGGRNIGEACHMYDLFRSLTGAPVRSIAAASIDPGRSAYLRSDNFTATLSYEDGSIANLFYTALGPTQGLGKERIEVFADGEAWLIDDFRSLTRCSTGETLWQARLPDKGHFEEFCRFGEALADGKGAPIPFAEIAETTALSLHIEDILHGRH